MLIGEMGRGSLPTMIDYADRHGVTPLGYSCWRGHADVVRARARLATHRKLCVSNVTHSPLLCRFGCCWTVARRRSTPRTALACGRTAFRDVLVCF
eukprot:COSAG01_NODE_4312_length_5142_cov_2.895697_6_plen_96_part_00